MYVVTFLSFLLERHGSVLVGDQRDGECAVYSGIRLDVPRPPGQVVDSFAGNAQQFDLSLLEVLF